VLLEVCGDVRGGAADAPYRLPYPLLLRLYAEKFSEDSAFRGIAINVLRYATKRRDFGRILLQRITRESY